VIARLVLKIPPPWEEKISVEKITTIFNYLSWSLFVN
jgi:hypothetical protein